MLGAWPNPTDCWASRLARDGIREASLGLPFSHDIYPIVGEGRTRIGDGAVSQPYSA
jgi:hypothetical protein